MKVNVDQEGCISCGLCVATCPEVFSFNENGVAEATGMLTDDNYASAESAKASCPVGVISIEG